MSHTTYQTGGRNVAEEAANVADDMAGRAGEAASRVQDKAAAFGRKAADQFSATRDYFRDHDVKEMVDDLGGWVKAHPTQALIAAAAFGFVTAALLRSRSGRTYGA